MLAICAVGVAPDARGQAPSSSPPSFNSSVNLVLIDLRVTRGEHAVTDLQPGEVTLLVDDVPRPIVSLMYAPVVVGLARTSGVPPRDTANAGATPLGAPPARRVLFVVDRSSLEPNELGQVRKTIERFVEQLPEHVWTGVAALPLESHVRFESNRTATVAALRTAFEGTARPGAALEGIAGFGCSDEAASDGCAAQGIHPKILAPEARAKNRTIESLLRGRKTLADLQTLFRALENGPPSDVVIVSGALPYEPELRVENERTLTVARTAGVRVHAVELKDLERAPLPEGGSQLPAPVTARSVSEHSADAYGLPEETGGVRASGTVSGASFFEQLAEQLSSTYLLSFEPAGAERDGKPHRIDVRISRVPQLAIHARKAFIAAPASSAAGSVPPATPLTNVAPAPVTAAIPMPDRPLSKTDAWIALARAHEPGVRDRELVDVAQWGGRELKSALGGLAAVKRRVPADTLNDDLVRGALLHTDLALLAPDLALRFDGLPEWNAIHTLEAADGQTLGVSAVSAHWRLARTLLDRVEPRPGSDPRVQRWYCAIGARLVAEGQYAAALPHLADALRLFPRDRDVNTLSGLLHEALADVASRGLAGDGRAALNTSATELRAARRDLERAVEADPRYDEAQLHLGRVCHLLDDDKAAVAALSSVLSLSGDPRRRYIAELLTGAIEQAAGRLGPARASFERAAGLYPMAQSALLALSHLAREEGDRPGSVRYIERLAALAPARAVARDDPWWHYDTGAVANHAALLSALRTELRERKTQ